MTGSRMLELLHDLSDWVVGFAESDWAIVALALTSFFESIFFPIPPDPLLLGIGLVQRELAIPLGVLAAVSSVAGAFVGHWLGGRLGRPLLHRLFSDANIQRVEIMFQRYGVWATLIAAITPVPYKVFAITAGVLDMDRRTFIVASLVGRGARFVSVGVLVFLYGDSIEAFVTGNFELLSIAVVAAVVVGAAAWAMLRRGRVPGPAAGPGSAIESDRSP